MSDARRQRDNRYRLPIRRLAENIADVADAIVEHLDWLDGKAIDHAALLSLSGQGKELATYPLNEKASDEDRAEINILLGCAIDEIRVHSFILATRLVEAGILDPKRVAHEWGDEFSPVTLLALGQELDGIYYEEWCARQGIKPDPTDAPVNLIGAPDN